MNVYQEVTDRMVASLEAGVVPWRQPWKARATENVPSNFASRKSYRGVNVWLLMCSPFPSRQWITYKQARDIGAQVRKGEHGARVVFWRIGKDQDADTGKWDSWAFMRTYTVFNVDQCEGIPRELPLGDESALPFTPIESAERVVAGYLAHAHHPSLTHGGDRAFYSPGYHTVTMPHPGTFSDAESYYATIFHEFGHSTMHPTLLNREEGRGGAFGSSRYSKEELVAEFTAAFICAETGIRNDRLDEQHAAYLAGWLRALKNDRSLVVGAAQRAQRAADLILGRTFKTQEASDGEAPE
jgi:antirestriction protein ArdC